MVRGPSKHIHARSASWQGRLREKILLDGHRYQRIGELAGEIYSRFELGQSRGCDTAKHGRVTIA